MPCIGSGVKFRCTRWSLAKSPSDLGHVQQRPSSLGGGVRKASGQGAGGGAGFQGWGSAGQTRPRLNGEGESKAATAGLSVGSGSRAGLPKQGSMASSVCSDSTLGLMTFRMPETSSQSTGNPGRGRWGTDRWTSFAGTAQGGKIGIFTLYPGSQHCHYMLHKDGVGHPSARLLGGEPWHPAAGTFESAEAAVCRAGGDSS